MSDVLSLGEWGKIGKVRLEVDMHASLRAADQHSRADTLGMALLSRKGESLLSWIKEGRGIPSGEEVAVETIKGWMEVELPYIPQPYATKLRGWMDFDLSCSTEGGAAALKDLLDAPMDIKLWAAATVGHYTARYMNPDVMTYTKLANGKWAIQLNEKFLTDKCLPHEMHYLGYLLDHELYPKSVLGAIMAEQWVNSNLCQVKDTEFLEDVAEQWWALPLASQVLLATNCMQSWQGRKLPQRTQRCLARALGISRKSVVGMDRQGWDIRNHLRKDKR